MHCEFSLIDKFLLFNTVFSTGNFMSTTEVLLLYEARVLAENHDLSPVPHILENGPLLLFIF